MTWRRPDIAKLERKGNVPRLLRALSYEDPYLDRAGQTVDLGVDVRLAAVQALARVGSPEAHEGLIRALEDPEPAVREAGVDALSRTDADAAGAALVGAVVHWRAPDLLQAREGSVEALLGRARPTELRAVAEGLVLAVPEPSADEMHLLRRLALGDGHASLHAVIGGLTPYLATHTARAAALLGALAPESVPLLIERLADAANAEGAAVALGAAHDSRAAGPLSTVLSEAGDARLRAAAARALGEIRDPRSIEALLTAAGDEDYAVRVEAGRAFDQFGNIAVAVAVSLVGARATEQLPAAGNRGDLTPSPAADVLAAEAQPAQLAVAGSPVEAPSPPAVPQPAPRTGWQRLRNPRKS